jgi:hypothetical protein
MKIRDSPYQTPQETTLESDEINFPSQNIAYQQQAENTTESILL